MHVGINLTFLVPGESSGPETYARELIPALLRERPELRLTAFVNREAADADDIPGGDLVETITVPVRARRRSSWALGEQLVPILARHAHVQLMHSLLNTGPAWGPFRRVVTIHDLIYRIYPRAHTRARTLAMRLLVPLAARTADRIIVPSDATRRDVIGLMKVPASKIDLIPQGIGISPNSAAAESELSLRQRLDLGPGPIVLTLSLKRPHKNLDGLLEALALIPTERRPTVVLAGHSTPYERELRAHADRLGVSAATRIVPWLPPADLEGMYRAASCFVFPSLYEGFGLPVLEAMARGVPVACSNRGALREVSDDAALMFDPERPAEIADAIQRLLTDDAERERLVSAGTANAARFSWDQTARLTLGTYERALESA